MSSFFAPVIMLWRAITYWWDDWLTQLMFNGLWILCWVTIILGPPATFALSYVSVQLNRGISENFKTTLSIGRTHFRDAWIWMIANLLVMLAVYANLLFYAQIGQAWSITAQYFIWFLFAYWLMVQFYTLPLYFMQDTPSLRLAWRNGFFMVARHPIASAVTGLLSFIILSIAIGSGVLIVMGAGALVAGYAAFITRYHIEQQFGAPQEEE